MLRWLLLVLVLLVGGVALWVRLAPTDPGLWHVDPLSAAPPGEGGWLVRPSGGDAAGPTLDAAPEEILSALDRIALGEPRTTRLAGSAAEGRITWVARSRLWGFPDYITATAVPVEGGTAPVIYSRLRFGRGDMGVNRARVERWLAALPAALSQG